MHMHDALAEFTNATHIIYLLPDQVRRVVVESQVRTGNGLENRLPESRGGCQVLSARPFVLTEQHRAVFQANLHALALGFVNDIGPDTLKDRPVRFDRFRGIPTDESVDYADVQPGRRPDYFLEMIGHDAPMFRIRIERIGIITQPREGDTGLGDQVADAAGFIVAEIRHVDVGHAGIAAISATFG